MATERAAASPPYCSPTRPPTVTFRPPAAAHRGADGLRRGGRLLCAGRAGLCASGLGQGAGRAHRVLRGERGSGRGDRPRQRGPGPPGRDQRPAGGGELRLGPVRLARLLRASSPPLGGQPAGGRGARGDADGRGHAVAAQPAAQAADPEADVFRPELAEEDLRVRAVESAERSAGVSLSTARVVAGGGRGVGGWEGFGVLEDLAGLLGGTLGVSRVVTSQGWRPHRQQVGQTGAKISPERYLACGISGAIQRMAGCRLRGDRRPEPGDGPSGPASSRLSFRPPRRVISSTSCTSKPRSTNATTPLHRRQRRRRRLSSMAGAAAR
jgi:hypothetical protein